MRRRIVGDVNEYLSHRAREERALVKRASMSRFNSVGEFDSTTEQEVEEQRRNYQAQRDERANRAALTKYVPADDLLADGQTGNRDALRRAVRHMGHRTQLQAEALFELDELNERRAREREEAWRAQRPLAAAQED